MNNQDIDEKLRNIFLTETGVEITDENTNLFSEPYMLEPREMAEVFIAVTRDFGIDLNALIPQLKYFNFSQIASALSISVAQRSFT